MTTFILQTKNTNIIIHKIQSTAKLVESVLTTTNKASILWIPYEQLKPLHREIIIIRNQYPQLFPFIAVHSQLKFDSEFQELIKENIEPQSIIYIQSIDDEELRQDFIISHFKDTEDIDVSNLKIQDEIYDSYSYSSKYPTLSYKEGLKEMFKHQRKR